VTSLLSHADDDVVSLLSLFGDGTVDGAVESCWRWRCRGDIGHGAMLLSSHVGYSATKVMLVMA
jgi:hypothetical protein